MAASPAAPFPPTSRFLQRNAPPTPAEQDAARAEAQKERERLILAYGDVFGVVESNRTESQALVWEDMNRRGFLRRPTAAHTEGRSVDGLGSAINEGGRVFMLNTMEAVNQAGVILRGGDHETARKQKRKFKA